MHPGNRNAPSDDEDAHCTVCISERVNYDGLGQKQTPSYSTINSDAAPQNPTRIISMESSTRGPRILTMWSLKEHSPGPSYGENGLLVM